MDFAGELLPTYLHTYTPPTDLHLEGHYRAIPLPRIETLVKLSDQLLYIGVTVNFEFY